METKKAEVALQESEDRFRNLVESSNDAIFVHHLGFVIYANSACVRLLGAQSLDELLDMKALDISAPEYRDIVADRIKAVMEDGISRTLAEMQFLRLDGTRVYVETSGSKTLYQDKSSIMVIARDITARKDAERSIRKSEESLRQIFQTVSEGVVLNQVVYGPTGEIIDYRIIQVNNAYYEIADFNRDVPLIGGLASQLYKVDAQVWKASLQSLMTSTVTTHVELLSEINQRYFEVSTSAVIDGQFVITFHDITERKRSELALRASENKLRSLFAAITDVILVLDKSGRYREVAATNSALLYKPSDQILGMTLHEVFSKEQADYFLRHVQIALNSNEAVEIRYSLQIDGQEIWFAAKLSKLTEDSVVVVARDITESRLSEEKIRYLGQHDMLTGLPNRGLFEDRLTQTIALAEIHKSVFALLFLDIDHFKKINDSMGHHLGDLFLKEVAYRLRASVKTIDTVSRLGGDEFIILLHELAHPEDAALVAQKICKTISEGFQIKQTVIQASVSIGIAVYPRDGIKQEVLLKNSDIAMYHAKKSGRNQFQYFSEELNRITHERLEIEMALRHAVDKNELEVHYQPQLNLHTGKIESCEALVRWHHPVWGDVSPARFIPIAEESGQIFEIGKWVMRDVAKRFADLSAAGFGDMRVSVNVSAAQIQSVQFSQMVGDFVAEYKILPAHLELEVTESMLMQDAEKSIAAIRRLSDIGVKFSIDDFGTGYSSLSYLRQLKIHYLKIDQSFVRDLLTDADDATIVEAIIGLAHNLRLQVIAEGVESQEQLDFLRLHGCDHIQGFFLARPMPFAALLDFLRR